MLFLQALQAIPDYAALLVYVPDHRGWTIHSLLCCYREHFHSSGTSHRSCYTSGETGAGAVKGGERWVAGSST